MAHPQDIEDVLSSIRRLVATEGPPLKPRRTDPVTGERDATLPALFLEPAQRVTDPEDPFQMIRSLAQEERDGRDAETFMEDMDPDIAAITHDMPGEVFGEWDGDDDPEMVLAPDFRGPVQKAAPDEDRGSVADRIIAQLRAAQGDRRDPDAMHGFEGTEAPATAFDAEDETETGAEIVALPASANRPEQPSFGSGGMTDAGDDPSSEIGETEMDPVPAPLDQPEIAALGADYGTLSDDEAEPPANILTDDPDDLVAPAVETDEVPVFQTMDRGPKTEQPGEQGETGNAEDDVPSFLEDPNDGEGTSLDPDMPLDFAALADGVAATTAAAIPSELGKSLMADDALRDLIAEIVRQELAGDLGERITRNVRKLVRRELRSMMAAGEFD